MCLTCPQPRAKRAGRVQQVPGPGTQGVWDRVPLAPEEGNPSLFPPSPDSSTPAASAPVMGLGKQRPSHTCAHH